MKHLGQGALDVPNTIPKHKSGKARIEAPSVKGKLTARTPRRSGHPHRCVAFHADLARAAWWPRAQAGQRGRSPAAALPTNSSLTDGIYFDD